MMEDETNLRQFELIDQKIKHHQAIIEHHQAIVVQHEAIVVQHEAIVTDLKVQGNRLRNRLTPISRNLLPEVLANIFFIASRDDEGHGLEWIKLTYVCHDWRNLALSSPSLWSNPPFQSPRWAKEMLIRSKTANLTIEAEASIFTDSPQRYILYDAFETHMFRIKCIKITLPPQTTDLEYLPRSAPNLVSLTMKGHLQNAEVLPRLQGSLCEMPHLQKMDLCGIGIDWDLHIPSSLTSLSLSAQDDSSLPTMTQVWDALERMPLLESLLLSFALPVSPVPIISNRKIDFGRLQSLGLDAGVAEIECFLRTVSFPPTADVSIDCYPHNSFAYTSTQEIIRLLARSSKKCSMKIKSVEIDIDIPAGDNRIPPSLMIKIPSRFHASREWCHPPDPQSYPIFHLSAAWNRREEKQDILAAEEMTIHLFEHFPFDPVNYLALSYTPGISASTLLSTAGSLPLLQTLKLSYRVGPSLVTALRSYLRAYDHEKSTIPRISFPSLQSIEFFGANFTEKRQCSWDEINFEDFVACLIWRKEQGAPVEKLEVHCCYHLNEDKVNHLKEVVAVVDWDGLHLPRPLSPDEFQILDPDN